MRPLVRDLRAYAEFQSTFVYLKDPSSDYRYPGVDLSEEFANITSAIEAGLYEKEYEFARGVFRVYQQARDAHYTFRPDIHFGALPFSRPTVLVSVSSDGSKLPKIFAYSRRARVC